MTIYDVAELVGVGLRYGIGIWLGYVVAKWIRKKIVTKRNKKKII